MADTSVVKLPNLRSACFTIEDVHGLTVEGLIHCFELHLQVLNLNLTNGPTGLFLSGIPGQLKRLTNLLLSAGRIQISNDTLTRLLTLTDLSLGMYAVNVKHVFSRILTPQPGFIAVPKLKALRMDAFDYLDDTVDAGLLLMLRTRFSGLPEAGLSRLQLFELFLWGPREVASNTPMVSIIPLTMLKVDEGWDCPSGWHGFREEFEFCKAIADAPSTPSSCLSTRGHRLPPAITSCQTVSQCICRRGSREACTASRFAAQRDDGMDQTIPLSLHPNPDNSKIVSASASRGP
ncbi:hypothetical protein GGX14DRAFT_587922 [Mycena pura]|uniref:Uncharacterized protein n=1 Tax=Mycena pura TaxID=153505 RepID=A0AAD6UST9_9AGAR|nr:hypothetical protein GGX14DRAFT_587922 [Mycena pura]